MTLLLLAGERRLLSKKTRRKLMEVKGGMMGKQVKGIQICKEEGIKKERSREEDKSCQSVRDFKSHLVV